MNILIVGNGFDLSHYLPTKYDHFMDVMGAIKGSQSESMNFDELFSKCRDEGFIAKTKEYYLTENISLEKEQLEKIRNLLRENCWYQYFSDHVREVNTWIDFETKINEALIALSAFFVVVKKTYEKSGDFNTSIFIGEILKNQDYVLTQRKFNILNVLGVIEKNNNYGRAANNAFGRDVEAGRFSKHCFIVSNDGTYGFNDSGYMKFLQENLDSFITLFNEYLESVISKLLPSNSFSIDSEDWIWPDKVFSFNYTNTFQRIYDSVEVEYLHGSHGEDQNIVLGVSDLEDAALKKIKAYGFTKYHQKLFKDTDYLFLDSYREKIKLNKQEMEFLNKQVMTPMGESYIRALQSKLKEKNLAQGLDLKFYIWGHSLDASDQDYIKDLFSLNDDMDRNVRVTVYYFDKPAKFSLLNNLMAILDKDKVEQWMKNKWLIFRENPKINFGINTENKMEEQAS